MNGATESPNPAGAASADRPPDVPYCNATYPWESNVMEVWPPIVHGPIPTLPEIPKDKVPVFDEFLLVVVGKFLDCDNEL